MGEDNPKAPRELRDYLVLLRQKDSTGQPFVLVGGQAANYWAALYLQREPQLRSLLPFLSKDVDFIGTKTEAAQVAQQTGWHLSPPLFGGGPVEAVLSSEPGQQGLLADFLFEIKGVARENILEYAQSGLLHVAETGETVSLRVLDPVLLLAGKIRNAVDIEQDRPDNPRQDLKHVRILSLCVPHFLEDLRAQASSSAQQKEIWYKYAKMLAALRNTYSGHQFEAQYPGVVNWQNLVPQPIRQMLEDQQLAGLEKRTPQQRPSPPTDSGRNPPLSYGPDR